MKFSKSLAGLAILGVAVLSCTDGNNEYSSVEQLSPFAKQYLNMQLGSSALTSLSRNNAPGNMANESFNRLFNAASAANGRVGEDKDTTIYTDPWYWETLRAG